ATMTTAVTHCFRILSSSLPRTLNCTFAPPIVYTLHWASAVPELSIDDGVLALMTSLRNRHHFGRARASSDTASLVLGDFTMRLFEDLLLGHSPAGHATACGLHADRGRSRRDDVPEPPRAVRRIDRGRSEEGPWASAGDGGAIVDLIGRSEAASRPPAVDAF